MGNRGGQSGCGNDREPRSVDDLIKARRSGRINRRELIERAVQLGVSAPVIGVMLHATSDAAFGAPAIGGTTAALSRLAASQTVPADAPTKPAGTPQQGGTLVFGIIDKVDTLNPYLTQLVVANDLVPGVMDPLLVYDSKQQLQPGLATEHSVSDDGLTYTFNLRQGVKFQNGDSFTAKDVIETWKMIMNPKFQAFSQQGWDKITDITAPDDYTVVMKTKEAYAPFLSYVAGSTVISPASVLSKGPDAFKNAFNLAPIGTGPFKVTKASLSEEVDFERFDGYWGDKPKLDQIIYRVMADDSTQLVQLRTGEIQMAGGAGSLSPLRVDEALGIDKIVVLEHSSLTWQHIDIKNFGFVRDPRVRQALDFATPSAEIITRLLKGRALPCISDIAPGTFAYDPNIKPRPYDLDQAKKLLAEAGLKPGKDGVLEKDGQPFDMELWGTSGDALVQQIVQIVAKSWQEIGLKVSTHFQDTSTIWGPNGYQFTKKMTGCLFTWTNSNDPDDTFYWNSSQIPSTPTGSGGNDVAYFYHFNFQDQIDQLTNQAAATIDQDKRKQLYWQIQELLHEQVPVIFMYWEKKFPAVAKNIGGFWPSAFNYGLMWNCQDWYLTK